MVNRDLFIDTKQLIFYRINISKEQMAASYSFIHLPLFITVKIATHTKTEQVSFIRAVQTHINHLKNTLPL